MTTLSLGLNSLINLHLLEKWTKSGSLFHVAQSIGKAQMCILKIFASTWQWAKSDGRLGNNISKPVKANIYRPSIHRSWWWFTATHMRKNWNPIFPHLWISVPTSEKDCQNKSNHFLINFRRIKFIIDGQGSWARNRYSTLNGKTLKRKSLVKDGTCY